MKTINIKVAVWKEGDKYVSQCLNFDVASFGKTKKEALDNLREAVELYLENTDNVKLSPITRPDLVSLAVQYA